MLSYLILTAKVTAGQALKVLPQATFESTITDDRAR